MKFFICTYSLWQAQPTKFEEQFNWLFFSDWFEQFMQSSRLPNKRTGRVAYLFLDFFSNLRALIFSPTYLPNKVRKLNIYLLKFVKSVLIFLSLFDTVIWICWHNVHFLFTSRHDVSSQLELNNRFYWLSHATNGVNSLSQHGIAFLQIFFHPILPGLYFFIVCPLH